MSTRLRTREEFATVLNAQTTYAYQTVAGVTKWWGAVGPNANSVVTRKLSTMIDTIPSNPQDLGVKYLQHTQSEKTISNAKCIPMYDGGNTCYMRTPAAAGSPYRTITHVGNGAPSGFGSDLGQRCLEKIAGSQPTAQAFAALPFLGELRSCVEMVRNPFSFLAKLPNSSGLRHLTLGQTLRQIGLGPTSDAWLQYQYGWKPLMSDLQNFGLSMVTMSQQYDAYKRQKQSGSSGRVTVTQSTESESSTPRYGSYDSLSDSHVARCMLWFSVAPGGNTLSYANFVRARLGLTTPDIVTAAWELLPYSFVVDWFLPIGKTLSKVTSTPVNMTIVKSQYDYKRTSTASHYYRASASSAWPTFWNTMPILWGTTYTTDYIRSGQPVLTGENASWFTTTRAVSALALIAQQLRLPL